MLLNLSDPITKHCRKVYKEFVKVLGYRVYLRTCYRQEQKKIAAIAQHNPNFFDPEKLLNDSDSSVRKCLAKILGTNETSSSKLLERLGSLSQGILDRSLGTKPTYKDIVEATCQKLNLPKPSSAIQGEQAIAIHCFKDMYQKLSPSQRKEYEAALREQSESLRHLNPSLTPSMISVGAIIAGRMSGFGVYLAASTLTGAVTSAIGVTLPFVFYTTMSSAIATFLGPVGWMVAGAMIINTLFSPDFTKVAQGVVLIASLRAEKELEWKAILNEARERLRSISKEIQSCLFKLLYLGLILLAYWLTIPALVVLLIVFLSR